MTGSSGSVARRSATSATRRAVSLTTVVIDDSSAASEFMSVSLPEIRADGERQSGSVAGCFAALISVP